MGCGTGAAALVVAAVAFLYIRTLSGATADLRATVQNFDARAAATALACFGAAYLSEICAWHVLVSRRAPREPLTFYESAAVVNSTRLMKYVPGKVWSVGLQAFLLAKKGISPVSALYINILLFVSSVGLWGLAAFICYVIPVDGMSPWQKSWMISTAAAIYVIVVAFHSRAIKLVSFAFGRFRKLQRPPAAVTGVPLFLVQAWYALALLCYAAACYWALGAIGVPNGP